MKGLWKLHSDLFLLEEALPFAPHSLIQLLGSLVGNAAILWSVRETFPLSTREEAWTERVRPASPTGSGDSWQDPCQACTHTHIPTVQAPSRTGPYNPGRAASQAIRRPVHWEVCSRPSRLDIWMTDPSFEGVQRRVLDLGTLLPCVIKARAWRQCASRHEVHTMRISKLDLISFHVSEGNRDGAVSVWLSLDAAPLSLCCKNVHMVVSVARRLFASQPCPVSSRTSPPQ